MRLLAGDVGGTKTLLRCVEEDGRVSLEGRFDSPAYVRFDDLLREFLRGAPGPVGAACIAVAGPVQERRAEVTNRGWVIEEDALAASFHIPRLSLINDMPETATVTTASGPRRRRRRRGGAGRQHTEQLPGNRGKHLAGDEPE